MESLQKCKSAWAAAKSDTEKFAALMVISKILQTGNLAEAEKKEIFEVIGFQFLLRLCSTDDEENSPVSPYKTLAFSILSGFCRIDDISSDPELLLFVPSILEILEFSTHFETVNDVLDLVAFMSNSSSIRQKLVDNKILTALIKQYNLSHRDKEKLLQIVMMFALWTEKCNVEEISVVVDCFAQEFCVEESLKKFEFCNYLVSILMKFGESLSFETSIFIQKALTNILRSKVGKSQRDSAVKLSGIIVSKFGSKWLSENNEDSKLFFTILVQIATIEVRMLLEEKSIKEFSGEMFLLSSCYIILETVIEVMVLETDTQRSHSHTEQFCNAINLAFKSVIGFLKSLSDDWRSGKLSLDSPNCEDVIVSTIRILCCWLAEETYAYQEEVLEILPFVLEICKRSTNFVFCSKTLADCRVMYFCAAPFCHLTADDKSRQILLENDLLSVLFREISEFWTSYQEKKFPECDRLMILSMCGVFLNIVVMETTLVSEKEEFFTFLKFLFNSLPQLPNQSSSLTLKANFSVLGLLITRQYYKKLKSCETSFYGFLSSSIKFLWDAHQASEVDGEMSLCVTIEYSAVWSDVDELWFLGMQALSTLLPQMPWIAGFLVESGWPQQIIATFSEIAEKGLEGNYKSTYQAFLSSLVKVSDKASLALLDCNSIEVCQKHKMNELEALLVKSR